MHIIRPARSIDLFLSALGLAGCAYAVAPAREAPPERDRWELAFFGAGLAAIMLLRTSP